MNQYRFFYIFALLSNLFNCCLFAQSPNNPYKAPLYWDVYENNFVQEKEGVADNYISEADFLSNINWVDNNLKQYGYNMICIDGWGNVDYNQYGYRTKHSSNWAHDYAWWSAELQKRGMTLGIYDNPLWINPGAARAGLKVRGTNIPISTLINTSESAKWFTWLQVDKPGAEQYVKGYIQHYADMGVKYLRVDFLSWFESGWDRNMGAVGPSRPLSYYQTALRWMREACDANGIFLSLVMPNLYNNAVTEQTYGHMIRINEDCAEGGWERFSNISRGVKRDGWSQFANPFDGYIYWSKISGKEKIILDGDFIRLNTFSTDDERKSVVSLHLMAGGPVSIADQYNTIGSSLWIYQNAELLALNVDGFVGKPLTNNPSDDRSQVWKGQMTNGDWIVGFFNRETTTETRSIDFMNDLGISGSVFVRDLWEHTDLGVCNTLSMQVVPHGCRIFRIAKNTNKVSTPTFSLKSGNYSGSCIVSISSETPEAIIHYTTDGTKPNIDSPVYTTPIIINKSTVINAFATKNNQESSFVISGNYNISPVQKSMYVGGTFNNWNPGKNPMTISTGNNWITSPVLLSTGDYEFKFTNTTDWTGEDWGNANGFNGIATITTGGLPNIKFNISQSGNYIFTFNDEIQNYSIEKSQMTGEHIAKDQYEVYSIKHTGEIIINTNNNQTKEIELFTLKGQCIFRQKFESPTIIIKCDDRNDKFLIVKVKSSVETRFEKILL